MPVFGIYVAAAAFSFLRVRNHFVRSLGRSTYDRASIIKPIRLAFNSHYLFYVIVSFNLCMNSVYYYFEKKYISLQYPHMVINRLFILSYYFQYILYEVKIKKLPISQDTIPRVRTLICIRNRQIVDCVIFFCRGSR